MNDLTPAGAGKRLDVLLRAQRAESFEPGFSWRVAHRVRTLTADPRAALTAVVQRYFARLAPVAALAAAVFVGYNVRHADAGQSVFEAALGLPARTTVEQAYAPYQLGGATAQPTETRG